MYEIELRPTCVACENFVPEYFVVGLEITVSSPCCYQVAESFPSWSKILRTFPKIAQLDFEHSVSCHGIFMFPAVLYLSYFCCPELLHCCMGQCGALSGNPLLCPLSFLLIFKCPGVHLAKIFPGSTWRSFSLFFQLQ